MAYTCAVYPTDDATLEEAQAAKFELVAQKLALEPGMRLLDVGCGWGGMVMHAAAEHGVKALGVTLSRNQAEWAQAEIERRGLSRPGRGAPPRLPRRAGVASSTRSAPSGSPSTSASAQLPAYFALAARPAAPRRAAAQPLHHPAAHAAQAPADPFIDRYVFPDGQLEPVGRIVIRDERRRLRDPARGEPARALRPTLARLGRQPRGALGARRSPRSGSAGPGCGGCTWPRAGSGSSATTSSCTRCWACGSASAAESGFPLRGWCRP